MKVVVNLLWILSSGGTEPRLKNHLTDVLRCLSATFGLLRLLTGQGTGDAAGDWGEVDSHDAKENEISLQSGLRLLSRYSTVTGDRLWIITENDRSLRPCSFPEY